MDVHRGRPRRPELTAEIGDAALRLVAQRGFDAVTMDDIAAAAGVSKPTIYRRWPGKTELVIEALRRRFDAAPGPPDTGDLHGDLVAFYGAYLTELAGQDLLAARIAAVLPGHPDLAAAVRELSREFTRRHAGDVLARAVARSELPPAAAADHFVFEAAEALFLGRSAATGGPPEPEFVDRAIHELLIPALLGRRTIGGTDDQS